MKKYTVYAGGVKLAKVVARSGKHCASMMESEGYYRDLDDLKIEFTGECEKSNFENCLGEVEFEND